MNYEDLEQRKREMADERRNRRDIAFVSLAIAVAVWGALIVPAAFKQMGTKQDVVYVRQVEGAEAVRVVMPDSMPEALAEMAVSAPTPAQMAIPTPEEIQAQVEAHQALAEAARAEAEAHREALQSQSPREQRVEVQTGQGTVRVFTFSTDGQTEAVVESTAPVAPEPELR